MVDLKKLQKEIYRNKIAKGFNVSDVHLEFNLIYGELAEAFAAYRKKLPDLGEELADVVIYLLGLAEILNIDLEKEILSKVEKNKKRKYKKINGIAVRIKEGRRKADDY
jgi:NTP pyrophosphatase (non-canonical NTP hydrolase)